MQKFRYIIKNILFALLVILIVFFLIEVVSRIGMTWRHRDSSFLKYGFAYFSPLRLNDFSNDKEDYKSYYYGIVVFGGSVAYGWDVERSETFPYQLEVILNEHLNTDRISVSNKGAPGKTSYKTVTDVLAEGDDNLSRRYRNQIYIVFTGINDALRMYSISLGKQHLDPDELAYNRFELTAREKVYFLLKKTSLSFLLLDDFLLKLKVKDKFAGRRLSHIIFSTQHKLPLQAVDKEKQIQLLLDRYRDNLVTIINFCQLYDVRLLFGKEAIYEKYDGPGLEMDEFMKYYKLVYDQIEKIAKDEGIIYVDTDAYFSKLPNKERYFLYSDYRHHIPQGNRIVAELFADAIIKNNLIRR